MTKAVRENRGASGWNRRIQKLHELGHKTSCFAASALTVLMLSGKLAREGRRMKRLVGTVEQIAEQTERILKTISVDAWSCPQEWDGRIDCGIKLADGNIAAEMILVSEATETRVKEAGERLLKRRQGVPVVLQNELPEPILISRGRRQE